MGSPVAVGTDGGHPSRVVRAAKVGCFLCYTIQLARQQITRGAIMAKSHGAEALREKMLKFTPPGKTVAPKGALCPIFAEGKVTA